MDDYLEIDLRKIIKNLLSKWYWVVLPAIVIGLGAFLYSYTLPDVYQATARFALTEPPYAANFENRYQTTALQKPSEDALRNLVLNDEIASNLYDLWDCEEKESCTVRQFKQNQLEVAIGDKGMLVSLIVETESRENTALLANTWLKLAMEAVVSNYYGYETDQITFFETQTALSQANLDEAAQRLTDFAGENPLQILRNELNDHLAGQEQTLQAIRTLENAQVDVQALIAQLEFENPRSLLDPNYRMSYQLIQTRVLNNAVTIQIGGSETLGTSLSQLSIEIGNVVETKTVSEFITFLENWLTVIDDTIAQHELAGESLTGNITALQTQIQSLENEAMALQADFERQQTVHEILATKYQEVLLTMPEGESGYVNVVNAASVPAPDDRLPHNTVRNTAIGLIAGGFLGLAGVMVVDWWKTSDEPEEPITA